MFTYEELAPQAQKKALELATALSLRSDEWVHVLSTARAIKRGIISILEDMDPEAMLAEVTQLLDAGEMEALEEFSDFDMPASIRIAVAKLKELAEDEATAQDAIDMVHSDIEDAIVAYWEGVFRTESHAIEWIDSVEMTFTKDGEIASYDGSIEVEQNFKVEWSVNGETVSKNIKTLRPLLPLAIDLVTVFYWVNKDENNLKIDNVMKLLIELKQTNQLKTPSGDVVQPKQNDILISASDEETNVYMGDMLGKIADCLAYSENVDLYVGGDLHTELTGLDQKLGDFLEYAHTLYSKDNVCDESTVSERDVILFLEAA